MTRTMRIAAVVLALNGAWMLFDGSRALLTGDYIRPRSGDHAGELGPWARLVGAVGLDPLGRTVKTVMAGCGAASVAASIGVVAQSAPLTRILFGAAAVAVLWYLPFGTIAGLIALFTLNKGSGHFSRRFAE